MARAIDIDAALDRYYAEWELQDICSGEEDRDWLMKCINEAPTIEAEPVKHGKWIEKEEGKLCCTECEYTYKHFNDEFPKLKYCPNCGSRMEVAK